MSTHYSALSRFIEGFAMSARSFSTPFAERFDLCLPLVRAPMVGTAEDAPTIGAMALVPQLVDATGLPAIAAACISFRDRAQDIAIRHGAHARRNRLSPVRND